MAETVKYVVAEPCYMNDRIYKTGETFDGPAGLKGRAFHPANAQPAPQKSLNQILSDALTKRNAEEKRAQRREV